MTKKSTNTVLREMNDSGSSEAHAICDCISGALEDVDQEDHVKTTIGMLEEFQEWAAAALKRLKKKQPKSRKRASALIEHMRPDGGPLLPSENKRS